MDNGFGDRLYRLRRDAKMSRAALGKAAGISDKSIQNYESGARYPNNIEIVSRLADALGTTAGYLLGDSSLTAERSAGGRDYRAVVEEVAAMFAGGEMPQEDKDAMMKAFSEAYFRSKEMER